MVNLFWKLILSTILLISVNIVFKIFSSCKNHNIIVSKQEINSGYIMTYKHITNIQLTLKNSFLNTITHNLIIFTIAIITYHVTLLKIPLIYLNPSVTNRIFGLLLEFFSLIYLYSNQSQFSLAIKLLLVLYYSFYCICNFN